MYLQKPQTNRYTIGKQLRKLKGLRKRDPSAKEIEMSKQKQEYYNELVGKGLVIKNLKLAQFETKNKLKYCGLIAGEMIYANTILMRVPVEMLLTTRDAFLSGVEKRVFVENPGFYAQKFTGSWEDRIILTFLLYEYQRGIESKWYNLIKNLPKNVDYVLLWGKDEIKLMEDEWMQKHIGHERQKYDEECKELVSILKKYPQFFSEQTLNKSNINWLQAQIVTRCFGKSFEYTTMVPFAELFNHECIDVYYTMYYKPGNPHDEEEQFYQEKQLKEIDMEECESSDDSYNAEDFQDWESQFVSVPKVGSLWQLTSQKYGVEIVEDITSILHHMYTFINFSDSISINYIQQVIKQLARTVYIEPWEVRKKKCQEIHSLNVQYVRKIKQFYKKINKNYYSATITQKQKIVSVIEQKKQVPEEGVNYFNKDWPTDKFDEFYMLCSTKDQFQKGAQVFFCYGRLPNRLLLMRYGMALEHNKYDHIFIRINIEEQIQHDQRLLAVLKQIQIKKYRRFKVKRTKMCVELITYFRMQKWRYGINLNNIFTAASIESQLEILNETKQLYRAKLDGYSASLSINEQKLGDDKLGYHEYFALVYKIEQQRILTEQIKMIQYAKQVLLESRKGFSLRDVLSGEKSGEKLTYQIMMEVMQEEIEIQSL